MTNKVKRNLYILIALIVINLMGYIAAENYFKHFAQTDFFPNPSGINIYTAVTEIFQVLGHLNGQ